jgi:hypothetical protein
MQPSPKPAPRTHRSAVRVRWARARGVAVVGIMVSLVLAAAVALATQLMQRVIDAREREQLTLARMERIRVALCAYHRLNGGFPASPPPSPTPTPAYANHISPVGWVDNSGGAQGWMKPLGLSIEDVTDGWGRLISVRPGVSNCNANDLYVNTNGDGAPDTPTPNACIVLISHGRTGRGAYFPRETAPGLLPWQGPAPTPGGPANGAGAERRNTLSTSGTGTEPYQTVAPLATCTGGPRDDPNSPCHFDDIVRYYTIPSPPGPMALCPS